MNTATARSNLDAAIYITGTILQLQITMEFCRPQMHETQVKPHLQCGTDPSMIRTWSEHDPTTHETVSQPSHRRGRSSRFGDGFCMEKIGFRISAISQKHISCETSFKSPSATHPPAPLAIPFTLQERPYSYKSQWNSVDRKYTKHRYNPIYKAEPIRPWSEYDPNMIRPHTKPSRNRRTAEVDHRGSGTDFVWKTIGFPISAISQKCTFRARFPSKFHRQLLHQHHL